MTSDDLAVRIEARLLAALDHQRRGGFVAEAPALCGEDLLPLLSVAQVARIAADEATRAPGPAAP